METYGNFRPTPFDPRGLALDDKQDWLVAPCSITRDSGTLSRSNWGAMNEALDKLDPSGDDHETHRFGHWGPGWFEIVIVRPDSACALEAESIEGALEGYPVLDEAKYSEMESEEEMECWDNYLGRDTQYALNKAVPGLDATECDTAELFHWAKNSGAHESDGDGGSVRLDAALNGRRWGAKRNRLDLLAIPGMILDERPVSRITVPGTTRMVPILSRGQRKRLGV